MSSTKTENQDIQSENHPSSHAMHQQAPSPSHNMRRLDTVESPVDIINDQVRGSSKRAIQQLAFISLALLGGGVILVYLKSILVPLVLAILLAFLLTPLVQRLMGWGIPKSISVICAELCAIIVIMGIFFTFTLTVGPLSRALPKYKTALVQELREGVRWGSNFVTSEQMRTIIRTETNENILPKLIDQGVLLTQVGFKATTSALSYFFLTLILSAFLLLEARRLRSNLREAYGSHHPLLRSIDDIGVDVRAYVVAKTVISSGTGFAVWVILSLAGVDFALFWALLAFPLNFIPTVGAIVASFPPIIIALIDPELGTASFLFVVLGLGAVNGFIGSVIDPRYVGQKVKLSALVVLLSMLLWGIIWGPIGMILAVPLMVSLKVVCSYTKGLAPLAIVLRG